MATKLTKEELARYYRHLTLPEVGLNGQQRLKSAKVLLIGMGGLGCPVGLYLAAAGIGRLGLVDPDLVEQSNIHRQVLYGDADVGRPKVEAAAERLRRVNPHIEIIPYATRFCIENAESLVGNYDLIVDGSDNFPTRFLVNDACLFARKPYVYGSVLQFHGQVSLFDADKGPCYRCLYPAPPTAGTVPSCAEAGVLGVVPGLVGLAQATEAVKWILGIGQSLVGRLILIDALPLKFRELMVPKNPTCPLCGDEPTILTLREEADTCKQQRDEDAEPSWEISPRDLQAILDRGDPVQIVDVREPSEYAICRLPGARLIPLSEILTRKHELDPHVEIVLQCHHGIRSQQALELLRMAGFANLKNLRGGIQAWAEEVDPVMPKY
ncbi:MAG: molybdopterin-synthase adenylyltransferase MoeB [Deltaproteobacteria bacterium]|nr:molybdopterin-synthase adenylyltransferase MoeB [Deltaproteobacteria bacterium]